MNALSKAPALHKPLTMKISYEQFVALEEDELAQVEEIFKHFDFGNNGRVKT